MTGETFSSDFPTTPGAFQTTYGGSLDAFLTELNPTGTGLVYSTYLGGNSGDSGSGIAVDTSGNAYVTGNASSRFPTTPGAFQTTFGGASDAYVAKIDTIHPGIGLTAIRHGMGETALVRLLWTGANSPKVDIYRDGVQIARVRNTVAIGTRSLPAGSTPTRCAEHGAP